MYIQMFILVKAAFFLEGIQKSSNYRVAIASSLLSSLSS